MKTKLKLLAAFHLLSSICLSAHAQGSLTPPGAPAPTMKSLDQIEARTIVNAVNTPGDAGNTFIISTPGSYYLTGNLGGDTAKHGISIQTNDVTLDLNGFALISGGGGNRRGVNVPVAQTGLCVRNGSVRGWTDGGVRGDTANLLAENLRLVNNFGARGLAVGNGSMIKNCVAAGNGIGFYANDRTEVIGCISTENQGDGFVCTGFVTIVDCTSGRNGGIGIFAGTSSSILRCNASRNDASGIYAGTGCTVGDCTAGNNLLNGINVDTGSAVRNCTARANTGVGILATASCHLTGNMCDFNHIGLQVTGNDNRVDGNTCTIDPAQNGVSGYLGFYIQGAHNWVVLNTARGSFANTLINAGFAFDDSSINVFGPMQGTSGGEISTTSPWANFRN